MYGCLINLICMKVSAHNSLVKMFFLQENNRDNDLGFWMGHSHPNLVLFIQNNFHICLIKNV